MILSRNLGNSFTFGDIEDFIQEIKEKNQVLKILYLKKKNL